MRCIQDTSSIYCMLKVFLNKVTDIWGILHTVVFFMVLENEDLSCNVTSTTSSHSAGSFV